MTEPLLDGLEKSKALERTYSNQSMVVMKNQNSFRANALQTASSWPQADSPKNMQQMLFASPEQLLCRPLIKAGAAQTNGEAIVNLLNNCLGSGMLGIAFALSLTGIGVGLACMLVSALLNKFTLVLHIKACDIACADPTTAEIAEKAFGNSGRLFMLVFMLLFGFFCMTSMVDGSADAVLGFLPFLNIPTPTSMTPVILGTWLVLLVPPTLIRSLKSVAMLSLVAFIGGLVVMGAVVCQCVLILSKQGLPSASEVKFVPDSTVDFFQAFPVLLLIFSIQAGGGVVLGTMEDRSEDNIRKVNNATYVMVFVMDAVLGVTAYLTFLSDTKGDIIMNLPSASVLSVLARLGLLSLLVLSYMIMCIPCKLAVLDLIFSANEAKLESTPCQFYGVTLAINVACLFFAMTVSDLSLVLGLNGAVITTTVAFLLPTAFYVKVREKFESVPMFSCKNLPYHAIFVFGIVSLFIGSSQVLQSFTHS